MGTKPLLFWQEHDFSKQFLGQSSWKLGEFIDTTKESIEALQEAVKMLSFGLDYRRYAKFWFLSPSVLRTFGGPRIQRKDRSVTGELTTDDVNFCIGFVIESALALQEFDFEVTKEAE